MNKQDAQAVIAAGDALGKFLLPTVKANVEQFTEEEKILWWAAFLGYMGGICAASVGGAALQAIQAMTEKTTTKLLREKAN